MKWLVIQSDGQHAENRNFRECHALKYAIEGLGYTCDVWGLRHQDFGNIPYFESYDVIFCAEQYEFDWLPDFTKIRKPIKIQWIVDLHVHRNYEKIASGFNIACHATRKLMDGYPCSKNVWFPNAVDDQHFYYRENDPQIDMGFVGSISEERAQWIKEFRKTFFFEASQEKGMPMTFAIRDLKIHWNKNASCDINYRTFETIGLGTCLLTNFDEDLLKLGFIDGFNCLMYRDFEHAKEIATKVILSYQWGEIALSTHELAKLNSYYNRIHNLLKEL